MHGRERRHDLARHVPHRDRGGAHAPAALGAHDARHPHRHHRGRPHRRARRRARRPRCRTRSTSSAPTCSSSRRAARPTAPGRAAASARRRRSRCRTPTRSQSEPSAPDIAGGRRRVDHVGVAGRRRRPTGPRRSPGTTPSWQDVRSPRRVRRPVHRPPTTSATPRRSWCSAPTPRPSCSARRDPVGQTVSYNGMQARGRSACSRRSSSSEDDVEQRPRDRAALAPTRSASSAAPNRDSVELDLREGDVGERRCRPRTRRANALLLNLHGITQRERRRLLDRHAAVDPRPPRPSVDDTLTVMLGGIAVDLAARRRHRRDEHHAGVGHRADPRDRAAQGARRPTAVSSAASSSSRPRCSGFAGGMLGVRARHRRRRRRPARSPTRA